MSIELLYHVDWATLFQDLPSDGGFVPDNSDDSPGPPGPSGKTALENRDGATDVAQSPNTPGLPGAGLQLSMQAQGETQAMNPTPSSSSVQTRPFADFAMTSRGGALHDALWTKYAAPWVHACKPRISKLCVP